MKKHLLRMASVLLTACVGACFFAGCGDNSDDLPGTGTGEGAGTSIATDPIEGVWSGASLDEGLFWLGGSDTFVATVDLFDNALHDGYIVVEATETDEDMSMKVYITMGVDKDGDTYKGTFIVDDPETPYSFTAKLEGENLVAAVTLGEYDPVTLTFTQKAGFPEAITPTGVLYPATGLLPYEMNFTDKTLKANGTAIGARFYNIGKYVAVVGLVNNEEVADIGFTVLEQGGKYYAFSVIHALQYDEYFDEEVGALELVTAPPALSVTISFELPGIFGEGVLSTVTVTSMSEQIVLPEAPQAPEGYEFLGWYQSHWFTYYRIGDPGDTITIYDDIPYPDTNIRLYARFEGPGIKA